MTAPIDELLERQRLLAHLAAIGIDAPIVPYPAHTSIEEGKRLRGDLPGTFTKNLLLQDKKRNLFFVTAHEDTAIDLKSLHTRIGAHGRLRFASADAMIDLLHVTPGTATPLALLHDLDETVALVVDHELEGADQINFHPMTHTESIGLRWHDFAAFAGSIEHDLIVADLSGGVDQG